jgi:hypothetical protein
VKKQKLPFLKISAATGDGVDALLEAAWKEVGWRQEAPPKPDTAAESESTDLLAAARRRAAVRRKA